MPTTTNIFVLRHAKSESGVFENALRPLSEEGQHISRLFVPILSSMNISAIYSSPFLRAVSTVQPFSLNSGIPIQINEALREGTKDDTLQMMQERISGLVHNLIKLHQGQSILLCTHGGILWGLISSILPSFTHEDYLNIGNPDLRHFVYVNNALKYVDTFVFNENNLK